MVRWWRVGADRVELRPSRSGAGWDARVQRSAWGGLGLDLDGHFARRDEALSWCERMAEVLASDLDED